MRAAKMTDSDVIITEVGGTVGDIESLPFLEALRQMKADVGSDNVMYIHTTLIPYLKAAGGNENQTNATRCKELRGWVSTKYLVVRTEQPVSQSAKTNWPNFVMLHLKQLSNREM